MSNDIKCLDHAVFGHLVISQQSTGEIKEAAFMFKTNENVGNEGESKQNCDTCSERRSSDVLTSVKFSQNNHKCVHDRIKSGFDISDNRIMQNSTITNYSSGRKSSKYYSDLSQVISEFAHHNRRLKYGRSYSCDSSALSSDAHNPRERLSGSASLSRESSIEEEVDEDAKNTRRRRVSSLVDELLLDIYGRSYGSSENGVYRRRQCLYSSALESDCWSTSGTSTKVQQASVDILQESRLRTKDMTELVTLKGTLRTHVQFVGSLLVRQLKRRDALVSRRDKQNDVVTAFLQAMSAKRSQDTKMRFSVMPYPGDSGFTQWHDAMKMVARLPGGIPPEFRRRLWLTLAEKHLQARGVNWCHAERFCFNEWSNPDDDELGIQIVKDLHRTGCSLFCGAEAEHNQALLKRVLLAYARWNKAVGYCQGFNMLAALVLQVMDRSETDSVKVMIYLIEGVLPESYFANNLRGLSVDMAVFRDLLRLRLPTLSRHLEQLQHDARDTTTGTSYEPPLTNVFTMQWFLTLFSNCLPQTTVLRVWDLIFLEGNEVLLRTALAIWDGLADRIMAVDSADEFYSIMGVLTREMLEFGLMDTNNLVQTIVTIAPFPFPELSELRDKYLYNITPWTQTVSTAAKRGLRLFYSDDDDETDEDDEKIAVAAAYGISTVFRSPRRKDSINRTPSPSTSLSALNYTAVPPDRDRLALDISALKQQYAKLRERQRQAHIILTAACARQPLGPSVPTPVAMNHLLLGKSALLSVRGRRVGPPPGAVPPPANITLRATSKVQKTKQLHVTSKGQLIIPSSDIVKPQSQIITSQSGETLHWKDASARRRLRRSSQDTTTQDMPLQLENRGSGILAPPPSDVPCIIEPGHSPETNIEDQGNQSEDYKSSSDSESTSTELCDEPDRLSDFDSEEPTSISDASSYAPDVIKHPSYPTINKSPVSPECSSFPQESPEESIENEDWKITTEKDSNQSALISCSHSEDKSLKSVTIIEPVPTETTEEIITVITPVLVSSPSDIVVKDVSSTVKGSEVLNLAKLEHMLDNHVLLTSEVLDVEDKNQFSSEYLLKGESKCDYNKDSDTNINVSNKHSPVEASNVSFTYASIPDLQDTPQQVPKDENSPDAMQSVPKVNTLSASISFEEPFLISGSEFDNYTKDKLQLSLSVPNNSVVEDRMCEKILSFQLSTCDINTIEYKKKEEEVFSLHLVDRENSTATEISELSDTWTNQENSLRCNVASPTDIKHDHVYDNLCELSILNKEFTFTAISPCDNGKVEVKDETQHKDKLSVSVNVDDFVKFTNVLHDTSDIEIDFTCDAQGQHDGHENYSKVNNYEDTPCTEPDGKTEGEILSYIQDETDTGNIQHETTDFSRAEQVERSIDDVDMSVLLEMNHRLHCQERGLQGSLNNIAVELDGEAASVGQDKDIIDYTKMSELLEIDKKINLGRRNSERALKIIQENSEILQRILQCQARRPSKLSEEESNGTHLASEDDSNDANSSSVATSSSLENITFISSFQEKSDQPLEKLAELETGKDDNVSVVNWKPITFDLDTSKFQSEAKYSSPSTISISPRIEHYDRTFPTIPNNEISLESKAFVSHLYTCEENKLSYSVESDYSKNAQTSKPDLCVEVKDYSKTVAFSKSDSSMNQFLKSPDLSNGDTKVASCEINDLEFSQDILGETSVNDISTSNFEERGHSNLDLFKESVLDSPDKISPPIHTTTDSSEPLSLESRFGTTPQKISFSGKFSFLNRFSAELDNGCIPTSSSARDFSSKINESDDEIKLSRPSFNKTEDNVESYFDVSKHFRNSSLHSERPSRETTSQSIERISSKPLPTSTSPLHQTSKIGLMDTSPTGPYKSLRESERQAYPISPKPTEPVRTHSPPLSVYAFEKETIDYFNLDSSSFLASPSKSEDIAWTHSLRHTHLSSSSKRRRDSEEHFRRRPSSSSPRRRTSEISQFDFRPIVTSPLSDSRTDLVHPKLIRESRPSSPTVCDSFTEMINRSPSSSSLYGYHSKTKKEFTSPPPSPFQRYTSPSRKSMARERPQSLHLAFGSSSFDSSKDSFNRSRGNLPLYKSLSMLSVTENELHFDTSSNYKKIDKSPLRRRTSSDFSLTLPCSKSKLPQVNSPTFSPTKSKEFHVSLPPIKPAPHSSSPTQSSVKFSPFPPRVSARQPKDLGVKLGLYSIADTKRKIVEKST